MCDQPNRKTYLRTLPRTCQAPKQENNRVPTSPLRKDRCLQVKEPQPLFGKLWDVAWELGLLLELRERDWRVLAGMLKHTTKGTGECTILAGRLMQECEIEHYTQLERSQKRIVGLGIYRRAGFKNWGNLSMRRFYQCSESEIVAHVEKGCREGWFSCKIRAKLEAWKYAQALRREAKDGAPTGTQEPIEVWKAAKPKRINWDALIRELDWTSAARK